MLQNMYSIKYIDMKSLKTAKGQSKPRTDKTVAKGQVNKQ